MPKNKIVLGLIFTAILFLSFNYLMPIKEQVLQTSNQMKLFFRQNVSQINNEIQRHFNQAQQIQNLQNEIEILKSPAQLSTVFAKKLNQLLDEANITTFNPNLHLSRVIAYDELDNPLRMWIDYPQYDANHTMGLVHKGFTAGVIYPKLGQPLAHLQLDKRVVFSVLIGENQQLGVIFGNGKNLLIKYIPPQANIKVGDEVITSGSDNLFYEGNKVGKIVDIKMKQIYKIATVE
ncbi:MAG: hypothetical protein K0U47_03765, partial [Epsilonproteobacteria bacterium]|nr:hypothetical protein [Campylobacterota bacterium]